jgi:hypothetical protein
MPRTSGCSEWRNELERIRIRKEMLPITDLLGFDDDLALGTPAYAKVVAQGRYCRESPRESKTGYALEN